MLAALKAKDLILGYQTPLSGKINFTIESNQWAGLVGKNGVGKSTLFKTILGFIKPLSGTVEVFGKANGKNNNIIGYIPEERQLYLSEKTSGYTLIAASFKANQLGLPKRPSSLQNNIDSLLDIVGARGFCHQSFHSLSAGQKKKIYLTQALINQPKVLLLDEPLTNLDPQAKQDFITSLKTVHQEQDITLMLISHDMREISAHLDYFIHFKDQQVHSCSELPCLQKDDDVLL